MAEKFQELNYNFAEAGRDVLKGSAYFQAEGFSQGNLKMYFSCEVTDPSQAKTKLKEGAKRLLQRALAALDAD